jgi:predicted TIM-barrel fold metal-dependent hydrolase
MHEDYVEQLERDFDLGASGVKLLPMWHGLLPDHPAWFPVYDLCQRRRKPILMDWSWWYIGGPKVGYGYNESTERQKLCKSYRSFADWVVPMDPIFEKYANVPISLLHCGTVKGRDDYEHLFAFMARHPNCYCDLSAIPNYNPWFIQQLVKAVGPRKPMYATDAPYFFDAGVDSYRLGKWRWGVIADDCTFLTDEEKQLILAGNAEHFVKNELP